MAFLHPFESIAYAISARSRQKKYAQFLALAKPQANTTILDIGVNAEEYSATDNFLEKQYPYPQNITTNRHGLSTTPSEPDMAVAAKAYCRRAPECRISRYTTAPAAITKIPEAPV